MIAHDDRRLRRLAEFAAALEISVDLDLLNQALTHTSYANEAKDDRIRHNERLEFLGDSVLSLVVSEYLYHAYPDLAEGELTKARAALVCEPTLAASAQEMAIGSHLLLGRGEDLSGGRSRASILADAFEAVVATVFLSQGLDAARRFVLKCLKTEIDALRLGTIGQDSKTVLQELVQSRQKKGKGQSQIVYELRAETGPDHAKWFEVAVLINAREVGIGAGRSKKEAEQRAAQAAL